MKFIISIIFLGFFLTPSIIFSAESDPVSEDLTSTTTDEVISEPSGETTTETETETASSTMETEDSLDALAAENTEVSLEEEESILQRIKVIIILLKLAIQQQEDEQALVDTYISEQNGILTCPALTRNMYVSDRGFEVSKLQVFLDSLGPSIYPEEEITGNYGTLTRKAVERFQQFTGIFSPGVVGYGVTGPVTRKTIKEYCDNPLIVSSLTSEQQNNQLSVVLDDVLQASDSQVTISSSVGTGQSGQLQNSTLFNPNSSSVFLQYLNQDQITGQNSIVNQSLPQTFSSSNKTISFVGVSSSMIIDKTYTISWSQSGFAGFDLVSLEGYKDDIQYFFGSTVPAIGGYKITIPQDFADKDSFTLIVKHNGKVKDSKNISIIEEVITEVE